VNKSTAQPARIVARCSAVLAALAFILSLGALGARMVLPRIAEQRTQIEDYVGRFLGRPVTIESVRAAWDGWDPRLVLTGLSVLNGETLRPAMGFERAVIGIDVWASLGRRQLHLRGLALSGAEFTVARTRAGAIVIEGIDGSDERMLRWLLRQPQVAIEGTQIRWHDHQARHGAWALPYVRLDSTGALARQGFKLTLRPPPEVGKRVLISMSGTGEPFERDWSADFYAEAEDIGPALLRDYQPSIRIRRTGGAAKLRAWGVWRNGQVSEVAGEFKTGGFAVGAGENRFEMVATSGRFLACASPGGGWRIGADRVAIVTPDGSWPEARFGLALAPPGPRGARRLIAYASHLELADLARVLVLSESLPEERKTLLGRLRPRGLLREVELTYHPDRAGAERFYLKADVDSVSVQRSPAIPGVENLSGVLETDAEKGRLRLSGGPLQIDAVPHFNAPVRLERTRGEVGWHALADGWRIYTPGLEVKNPDLDLRLRIKGDLVMREGRAADAGLWAGIDKGRVGGLAKYLPCDLPSKGREWLSQALQAGTIGSGAVVLRGLLDRFPFDRDEGRFAAEINLTGGVLEFSKHWPRIEGIDAQVTVDGHELRVAARAATISGVRLGDVSASIPDLGVSQRHVIVRGRASGTASDMQRFVSNSPLRSGVGRRITPLEIGGEARLDLDMNIPLYPEKATVAGALTFPGNTLKSGPYSLTDLRGTLRFARGAWSSEGLRARLFERAIALETKGGARERGGWVKARGRADWPTIEQHLRRVLPSKYHDYFSRSRMRVAAGETGWEARLRLPESARPAELRVRSPLTGMRVNLPAPFGKAAATAAPLTLTASLGAAGTSDIAVAYGERMRARLALRTGAQPIGGARIYFGPGEQALAGGDYRIGGQLERLSVTEWQGFSRRWGTGPSAPFRIPEDLSIDVSVAKLEGLGFVFKDMRLRATQENRRWRIDTDGPDALGSIRLPGAHPGGMLEASFTRLKLVPSARLRDPGEIDPRRLPAITITCEDFSYGTSALGALRVRARPAPRA